MHFLIHRDLRQNLIVRRLLTAYLLFILLFLALLPIYEAFQVGILPNDVATRVLGSEEHFTQPMALADVVAVVHVKLFLHSLIGLILASTLARAEGRHERVSGVIVAVFILPATEAIFLFAVHFLGPWWAAAKCGAFFATWIIQCGTTLFLLRYLWAKPK